MAVIGEITALHAAAVNWDNEVCLCLVPRMDASVNAVNARGNTALHEACARGMCAVCKAIVASDHFVASDGVVGRSIGAAIDWAHSRDFGFGVSVATGKFEYSLEHGEGCEEIVLAF